MSLQSDVYKDSYIRIVLFSQEDFLPVFKQGVCKARVCLCGTFVGMEDFFQILFVGFFLLFFLALK